MTHDSDRRRPRLANLLALCGAVFTFLNFGGAVLGDEPRFVDHSLLIAPEYPCTWPSYPFPRFAVIHQRVIGPESAYNVDTLLIDGNTGTQLDVPPHSVARPELKREKSGPLGLAYTDKIEPWQFGGEACVVDVRELLDKAPNGVSPLIRPGHVERFAPATGLRSSDSKAEFDWVNRLPFPKF